MREFNPKHESIAAAEGAAAELDEVRKQLDMEKKQQEARLKKEQKGITYYLVLVSFVCEYCDIMLALLTTKHSFIFSFRLQ